MEQGEFILRISLHGTVKKVKITNPEQKTVTDLKNVSRAAFKIPHIDKDNNPLEVKLSRKTTGTEIQERDKNNKILYLSSFGFEDGEFISASVRVVAG
jgi:hypothetical protein